jgi:hypothetical protein
MSQPVSMDRRISSFQFTIPNGTATSNGHNLGGMVIASISSPAAWTAADLQFEASFDGGTTWLPVYDDAGTRVVIASAAFAAGRAYVNKAVLEQLAGLTWIRLVSSVNQGADRVLYMQAKG